jgi:hypothetical protein
MSALLTVLMLVVLFACVAMLYTNGMWSNAIMLINVVTSALLAINFFEPVASWLDHSQPSYTYLWDFLSLWGLFVVFMSITRALTDKVSLVKVRFLGLADRIGSPVFALWIGWVMVCFTMMTLHTAPIAREFLFGGFKADDHMVLGLAPDRQMLGFMQKMSLGAYCRSGNPDDWREGQEKYAFDPHGEFMPKYATRRANVQANLAQHDTLRVGP